MAIELENKTQVTPPNADYPYGDIKDDTGVGDGTPISREVYADFHQFFAKLLAESGISPNNLADNATNGFQYWEALGKFASTGTWIDAVDPVITTSGVTVAKVYNKIKIIGTVAHWKCSLNYTSSSSQPFFSLSLPIEITSTGRTINANAPYSVGVQQSTTNDILLFGGSSFGGIHLDISKFDGTNFASTGGTAKSVIFDIVLELI